MKYCYHTPKTVNGQQYGPLLCQNSNSNGQQYSQPQQYESLLCQTSNSNGQQYKQPQQYEPHLVNCFRGVIAVFHIAVVGYIVDHYFLILDRRAVHIVVAAYIVDHYFLCFT
jgi:hypothetical protein